MHVRVYRYLSDRLVIPEIYGTSFRQTYLTISAYRFMAVSTTVMAEVKRRAACDECSMPLTRTRSKSD